MRSRAGASTRTARAVSSNQASPTGTRNQFCRCSRPPRCIRGYEVPSFDANECVPDAASECPAFDRLLGSRIAIAGAELGLPLLELFNRRSYYGPIPIELALFGEAGVAWTSDDQPSFLGGDRGWVRSVGVALRLNALGFAILELDYVRPIDRPGRGWLWRFNLTPGF